MNSKNVILIHGWYWRISSLELVYRDHKPIQPQVKASQPRTSLTRWQSIASDSPVSIPTYKSQLERDYDESKKSSVSDDRPPDTNTSYYELWLPGD